MSNSTLWNGIADFRNYVKKVCAIFFRQELQYHSWNKKRILFNFDRMMDDDTFCCLFGRMKCWPKIGTCVLYRRMKRRIKHAVGRIFEVGLEPLEREGTRSVLLPKPKTPLWERCCPAFSLINLDYAPRELIVSDRFWWRRIHSTNDTSDTDKFGNL